MSEQVLTADMVHGIVSSLLVKNFDEPSPTPKCHMEWWEYCCSDRRQVAIAAPREHAKAQSLDSKILTPLGWRLLGELEVGDTIFCGNGKPTKIKGMSPIKEMDLYRVTTRDGKSTLCNIEHLWNVYIPSNQPNMQTLTLRDILPLYKKDRPAVGARKAFTENRVFIPQIAPVEFTTKQLPIDPYTLGMWLGDGDTKSGRITTADPEVLTYIPYESYKTAGKYNYRIVDLTTKLNNTGLLNNKHIPEIYMQGDIEQRYDLLRGLLDSDGTIHKEHGQVSFCNTNKNLVDGVIGLVRSLGGVAKVSGGISKLNGNSHKQYWKVTCNLTENPFKLTRKARMWKPSPCLKSYIVDITKESTGALGRCLTVEDSEQTYITDDYLLTHNSSAVTIGYGLSSVLVRDHDYVLIVSDTTTQAAAFLNNIKQELVENEELKSLFKIKGFLKDTETDMIVQMADGHQFRMTARGAEQSLRGLLWRKRRPNLILCDDMESDEQVMNDDRRRKFREWFLSALIPAMARRGKIRVMGTILHMDSLLERLMPKMHSADTIEHDLYSEHKEPDKQSWLSYRYKAHTPDFSTILWGERLSAQFFKDRKKDFRDQGMPEKYNQEYLNYPIDDETAYFKSTDFKPIENMNEFMYHYVACDLAISERKGAAFTAMAVAGVSHTGKLKILDVRRFRGDAYDIINELFEINMSYGPECFFIEEENIARSLGAVIDKEMYERDTFLNIETIRPSADKIQRARAFQARMRAGAVEWDMDADWYEAAFHEMITFPRGKYKDQVDALALIGLGLEKVWEAKTDMERMEEDAERLEQDVLDSNIDKWTGY